MNFRGIGEGHGDEKMNLLEKYRLKKRIIKVGELSWDLLIFFSKLTLFLFVIITAFTFWQNIVVELYIKHQIDISKQVGKMFLIILMVTILIFIDILKNLLFNKNNERQNKKTKQEEYKKRK